MAEQDETNQQGGSDDSVGGAGDSGIGSQASGSNPTGAAGRAGCGATVLVAIVGLGAAVGGIVTAAHGIF